MTPRTPAPFDPELVLPATLLSRYLFFLGRRPVSAANTHYRGSRIGALQSLAPLFEDDAIREPLRALTPSNLFRVAPALQTTLQPRLAYRMPRDLVMTSRAPDDWQSMQNIAVIYGPAIGIGDEILASPIPRALQSLAPHATVDVLTAYDGLWSRIASEHDQRVTRYRDMAELLTRMRSGADDAIVYVDFEPPGLVAAIAHEPEVKRFFEISVGTRSLSILDNVARRFHQMPQSAENFYDVVAAMCRWLGADVPRFEKRARRNEDATVVVSPFTSKEEPSEKLWRNILTSMLTRERIVLDTGPNASTRGFAISLRDALRNAGLRAQLAANGRAATVGEMLDIVADADVAVTADSYLAHAAPRFGTTTLVVAREGLETWRVPSPASFYFRSEDDPREIGAAMRLVIRGPQRTPEAKALAEAAGAIDFDASLDELLERWQRCVDAHNAVVAALPEWPRAFATLARDERYGRLMPRAPRPGVAGEDELRAHLRQRFADCARSNLWKLAREAV
ncbi:MAG TPA: hypothetical protein VM733_09435 [Thermoanaerobaculia bacterium]|nr:hypothetical protein [Thermoanaerobaculia bacterium]